MGYSSAEGDPYYPVPNPANHALYEQYRELAEKEEGVCFVGRLASYKYFNMDQAILNALEIYDNMKETGKLAPKRRPRTSARAMAPSKLKRKQRPTLVSLHLAGVRGVAVTRAVRWI